MERMRCLETGRFHCSEGGVFWTRASSLAACQHSYRSCPLPLPIQVAMFL